MRLVLILAAALLAGSAAAHAATPASVTQAAAGPWTVPFDRDSDTLGAAARAQLDRVAEASRSAGSISVILAGHADRFEGTPEYTVGLSQRRANAVREYLVSRGVAASLMTTMAFGQTRPVAEGKGAEPRNRRVEITFGPGSGW